MGVLVDPEVAALSVVETVMIPPPPADLNRWAERNIVFGAESPFPGPYRRHNYPFAERLLHVLSPDHPARTVTVMGAAQILKTTTAQIFIGGTMDMRPTGMLYTHPTHDNALRWARTKWKPMRKQSDALRRIFGDERSRDSTDTTLYQEHRLGLGSLQISGANSPASLSMISVAFQVQDDLSKWEKNPGGDPERQADSRSAAFDWAKIFKISTPLFAKTCRITRAYRAGTQERWHVPCPECDHFQPLTWENFRDNIDREHPEKSCFTCVNCGVAIEHRSKRSIVARGKWVAENPSAREPSFHLWRAYVPTRDWESIAREWLSAEGDPLAEQTFFNDVLGLPYERASEAPPWEAIRDRSNGYDNAGNELEGKKNRYDRGTVPTGALIICAGVDCQGDRTEVHFKGYGSGLRRWTIDYEIIPHHIGTPECHEALNAILKRTWPDAFGNRRPLKMLAIDANAYTKDVFLWAKTHPWSRVIAVRGAKSDHAPPLALTKTERKPDGKTKRAQKRFYNVGVSGLKSSLYEQLKKPDPLARGYCGFPLGMSDEFYMQLTAERRVVKNDRWGHPVAHWHKEYERNEVLDTELYAEAAAVRCGWYTRTSDDWEAMRAEVERAVEDRQPDMFDPAAPATAHIAKPVVEPDKPKPVLPRPVEASDPYL